MLGEANFCQRLDELRLTTAWFLEQKMSYEKSYPHSPFRCGAVGLWLLDFVRITFNRRCLRKRDTAQDERDNA
jgi:hypothetical protein